MFSTLRHANLGDARFILEPTGAPFDKNRQNKAVRRACIRCRSKKVRLTRQKRRAVYLFFSKRRGKEKGEIPKRNK